MARPSRATQEKRQRERAKKEIQQKKRVERDERKEKRKVEGESLSPHEDPDIAGIVPGPQPPVEW